MTRSGGKRWADSHQCLVKTEGFFFLSFQSNSSTLFEQEQDNSLSAKMDWFNDLIRKLSHRWKQFFPAASVVEVTRLLCSCQPMCDVLCAALWTNSPIDFTYRWQAFSLNHSMIPKESLRQVVWRSFSHQGLQSLHSKTVSVTGDRSVNEHMECTVQKHIMVLIIIHWPETLQLMKTKKYRIKYECTRTNIRNHN